MDSITAPAERNTEASTVRERIGLVFWTIRAMLFRVGLIYGQLDGKDAEWSVRSRA